MKRISLIILIALIGCDKRPLGVSIKGTPIPANTKTFVLMGQSNMRGAKGGLFDPVLGVTLDKGNRAGPGYVFGTLVALEQHVNVNLIACSMDGSSIQDFMPGGRAYLLCLSQIGRKKIDAVIYWQGEAESELRYQYPWAQNFHQLINIYKKWTGDVPVIYCQLGITTNYTLYPNFDWIKTEQAAAQAPGYYMVNTDTVSNPLADDVHFNHDAVAEVGRRIYEVYRRNSL